MSKLVQNTPEWLEQRLKFICASDSPIILGLSHYKTPLELWREKVSGLEQDYTPRMEYGRQQEGIARNAFIEATGIFVEPDVMTRDIFFASLDGIDVHTRAVVEIKCLKESDHEEARNGSIKPMYYAQMQHQMYVADSPFGYYVGYRMGDLYFQKIERDEEFIKKIIEAGTEFYRRIQELDPPEETEKDKQPKKIEDTAWIQKAQELMEIKEQIKSLQGREKELLASLVAGAEGQPCIGGCYELKAHLKKGIIQYGNILELKEIDLERYRSAPVSFWTLKKVKGEK